jgi:translation initiation factor 2 subunit 1
MVRLNEFPEEGELVVCTVREVKSFGAFVTLDEYGNKEGFIHVAEVTTGWVKYIRDYVREGQKIVCKVLRVDTSKGHVDLSLKQVNEHQRRETIEQWKNEQRAEKLFEIVCSKYGKNFDECFSEFGRQLVEKFGSLYAAFEECAINQDALKKEGFSGKWVPLFVQVAVDNIIPPLVTVNGFLELTCPTGRGALEIKEALLRAEQAKDAKVNIQYVGAPKYRITVTALDYKLAEDELRKSAEKAIEYIKTHGGDGKFIRKE